LKDGPVTRVNTAHRKNERGITIVLVAFSLLALLGMAALAIDVSTLYVAHGEAQRAADAAALAGARMFASSGYTSASTTLPAADVCQTSATPGADAAANRQAEAVAAQNTVGGQPGAVQSIICNVTAANPQISVTVQRTGLPTFFGRIFGNTANTVTATAVAEAYNSSGSTTPIQIANVKPWLVANCDTTNTPTTNCGAGPPYFVDPTDGSIVNNGSFIGKKIQLRRVNGALPNPVPNSDLYYFPLDIPVSPSASCPSGAAISCGLVGSDDYFDNIACSTPTLFSCQLPTTVGPTEIIKIIPPTTPGLANRTREGGRCLIHANNDNLGQGQDELIESGGGAPPVIINGKDNNPNPLLQNVPNISRSDSVVTVPLYDGSNLCPGGACSVTKPIVGFLQLGIKRTIPGGGGQPQLEAVIMNASGCNPAVVGSGITPVSGGGVSSIPVRLIHQ
jgi:putative Flp pilus-assembly TadE/G-like protein